jgi:uncharacterized protein (TIGR00255 family)
MIYSMTGFSALAMEADFGSLALEIRSVNHRYLDLQLKVPDEMRMLEPMLREAIATQVTRGKIDCRISITARNTANTTAQLNKPLLRQLALWNAEVQKILPTAAALSVNDILRWELMFENSVKLENKSQISESVLALLQQTLLEFNTARAREGEKLKIFLLTRVIQINALRLSVAPRIPAAIKAYEVKLRSRLLEAIGNQDNDRVHQEISLFASKIDVDEELSRLHTHLTEMERILEQGGSVGKRLDFLMQELHREANTLGAKSVDAEVSRAAMEIKILIEQMREQIQNLE